MLSVDSVPAPMVVVVRSVDDNAAAGDDGDGDADDAAAAADADAVKSARSHMSSNASDTKGDCDGQFVAEMNSRKK